MNAKDAVYWSALMVGLGVTVVVLRCLGLAQIWQLVGGLVAGVGTGYVAERVFASRRE